MSARPATRSLTPETRSAYSDGSWQLWARCRGTSTDTFYPPEHARGNRRRLNEQPAKQVCESCPVLMPCLRYAVDAEEPHGIWGGTTPGERVELRRAGSVVRPAPGHPSHGR